MARSLSAITPIILADIIDKMLQGYSGTRLQETISEQYQLSRRQAYRYIEKASISLKAQSDIDKPARRQLLIAMHLENYRNTDNIRYRTQILEAIADLEGLRGREITHNTLNLVNVVPSQEVLDVFRPMGTIDVTPEHNSSSISDNP